jgi:multiple sugar transport system permease protein
VRPNPIVRTLQYLALGVMVIFFTMPTLWMVLGVFKRNVEHRARPPVLIPHDPLGAAADTIRFAFEGSPVPLDHVFLNSVVVASGTAVVTLLVGVTAAYSFARFRTGGTSLPFFILTLRMAPPIAIGLPFFLVFRQLGLLDSQLGLIIAYTTFNLPLVIWLMRSFFRELDPSMEEAALVDGASRWQALRYIALPLAMPAIASTALLIFIFSWNEFFFATLLTSSEGRTIPALLPLFLPRSISAGQPLGASFFIASVSAVPMIILVLILQRYLITGLSLGAAKE